MGLKGRLFGPRRPAWVDSLDPVATRQIDIRALLQRGEEPLPMLVEQSRDIPVGGALVIDAPFDPGPLRRLLARAGFADHAEQLGPEHWRIWFCRERPAAPATPDTRPEAAMIWQDEDGWHIDVRGLDPPEPMLAIIALIETPAVGGPVIVHHEREPVYLYPELAERGWSWAFLDGDEGEVRLRLDRTEP